MTTSKPAHKRILLKLSGEALMGDDQFGINRDTIVRMVDEIAEVTRLGVEVAVVIGGGNIFRGVAGGSVVLNAGAAKTTTGSVIIAAGKSRRAAHTISRALPCSRSDLPSLFPVRLLRR